MSCHCSQPPFNHEDYRSTELGVDEASGMNGEVSLHECRSCGQLWLKYLVEWEWYSESGRWYRGAITKEQARGLTPGRAAELLGALESHFYGGSFYKTTGRRAEGGAKIV